jgi:hypothetical protein
MWQLFCLILAQGSLNLKQQRINIMKYPTGWTIGQFIEELILICEILEIPGMKTKRDELLDEISERFSVEERETAGLSF